MRAFARLRAEQPGVELVLVGDDLQRRRLEGLARSLGVRAAVTFVGWQVDVQRWLRTFDIFISPSRSEPFGLAMLEASAAGVPIVAYDEGGSAEVEPMGKPASWPVGRFFELGRGPLAAREGCGLASSFRSRRGDAGWQRPSTPTMQVARSRVSFARP